VDSLVDREASWDGQASRQICGRINNRQPNRQIYRQADMQMDRVRDRLRDNRFKETHQLID